MDVRRLAPGDGALLREVRLRALREAPYAFSSSHAREAAYGAEVWERRIGEASAVFVGSEAGRSVGMAGGFYAGAGRDAVTVWGVWVDPVARRRGLGGRLVEAVAAWARSRGATTLELSVTDREPAAAELYLGLGFATTGARRPLASDPALTEVFMSRPL